MAIDLKAEIRSRNAEERAELSAYLRVLDRLQDPSFQEEMRRRASQMDQGLKSLPRSAVVELDQKLGESGL